MRYSASICRARSRIAATTVEQVVSQLAFGTDGVYGTPIYVSSTYIFLFILFGAFLEQAGMIKLFNDVALGLFGRSQGGPAKVCVVSSALMGTINGSGVANVVQSAPFTIPLMKRFGYRPEFAGGVEATSSMGGQIMPPVMGAVAFIMAETINVPYIEICKAAAIPACCISPRVSGWCISRPADWACWDCLPKNVRAPGARCSKAGIWCCPWPPWCGCC